MEGYSLEDYLNLIHQQNEELHEFIATNKLVVHTIYNHTLDSYQHLCEKLNYFEKGIVRFNGHFNQKDDIRRNNTNNTNHIKTLNKNNDHLNNNNNNNSNNTVPITHNTNNFNNITNNPIQNPNTRLNHNRQNAIINKVKEDKKKQMTKKLHSDSKKSPSLERVDFMMEKENRKKTREKAIKAAQMIQKAYKKHLFRKRLNAHIHHKLREKAVLNMQRVARGFLCRQALKKKKPKLMKHQLAIVFQRHLLLHKSFKNWSTYVRLDKKMRVKWENRMSNMRRCWGKTYTQLSQHFRNTFPSSRITLEGGKYAMAAAYHSWHLLQMYTLRWQQCMTLM